MATFDINNFVIDRVLKGIALSQADDSVLFSINQIQNPSLNCASESTDAVDALGTPIATFYRAKSAEFSAENAVFDMNLMATQLGTTKKVASASDKILAPAMETVIITKEIAAAEHKFNLKHTPKVAPKEIFVLNDDSTFGEKYVVTTKEGAPTGKAFKITGKEITVPVDVAEGTEFFVYYEYEAQQAVSVVDSAKNFPVGCKFIMEVLGADVCDQTSLVHAYVYFPNFKLSPDFDWSIATDGSHPFSGKAQQDYCDREKKLFSIIIPDGEETEA